MRFLCKDTGQYIIAQHGSDGDITWRLYNPDGKYLGQYTEGEEEFNRLTAAFKRTD